MKLQHPLWFRFVGAAGSRMVRGLGSTLEYHFRYEDPMVDPQVARRTGQRYVYAFFHEMMLFPAYYWAWPEMNILISDHRDGELITRIIKKLGFRVSRGSTTRNGLRALREMIALQRTQGAHHLCITPDGPRGPRRQVQPGLAYLASKTSLPVVGVALAFQRPWRAKSWDRFAVPRPFSPAACIMTRPIFVPSDADRDQLEQTRLEIETCMRRATDEAEAWAEAL